MLIFLHSSFIRYLGCLLAIINGAAMNIGVHVSFWIMVSQGIWPVVELLGHMMFLFLVFLRNLYTVFHSGYVNLHSHQQCKRIPFSPLFSSMYCLYIFLMMAKLVGTCYKAQEIQLGALWWPRWVWEGGPRGRGYMYTYSRFTSPYSRNWHDIVKQLYSS